MKPHTVALYGTLVAVWILTAHRGVHLVVSPEEYPTPVVEFAEDVAMIGGASLLTLIALRQARIEARIDDDERKRSDAALRARVEQQAAVAALGQKALEGEKSEVLIAAAADVVARTLAVERCAVLEHVPHEGGFRIRASNGLGPVADVIVGTGPETTLAGFTMSQGRGVVVADLRTETRFHAPEFLVERGVISAATAPIHGSAHPFGLVSAFSIRPREFTEHDSSFLASIANVIGTAVHRERVEDEAKRFFDMSRDLLGIADFDGIIRRVNSAWGDSLGYDVATLPGRRFMDLVHPDDREFTRRELERLAVTGGATHSIENRYVASDGSFRRFDWVVRADPQRRLFYAVARDVTQRREHEAELALLARVIEQASETVVVTGPDSTIEYVNPAFERITGYGRHEAIGRKPSFLKSGRHDAAFYGALWAALGRGEVWSGRLVNRRKDGSFYDAEGTITPVRDASGALANYVGVMRDVTNEAALEAQFRQAQKMEVVGRLAGGVAHDFNNLLCVIQGYGAMLTSDLDADDPSRAHAVQIMAAAARAATLTKQLLAFSRKQTMQPRIFDLNLVVSEWSKMWMGFLGEDVRLVTRLAAELGSVRADPGQIEQALMNLAVNARDAMCAGGALTIETRNVEFDESFVKSHPGASVGRYVQISVEDTGVGMDGATLGRVFEPFFTTKQPGKGTGLGLATVYGIVKQSDGHIEVESEVGAGTTFRISLPRIEVEDASTKPPAEKSPASPRGRETILVVEDDAAVRSLMCAVLRGHGYTVVECVDAARATEAAVAVRDPDLLLVTDVVMPGVGGPEVARRVALARPGVRVLYVSGHTFEAMGRSGVAPQDVRLLMKPFTPDALLAAARAAFDGSMPTKSVAAA